MGLNIANRDLEGELDLSEFKKLRTLDCSFNRITRLRGLEQTKLEKLYCQNNLLHDLDLEFIILLKECNCDNNYLNYRALNQDTISKLKNAR
jgi:Leucine-rich repeat (LRR) protein